MQKKVIELDRTKLWPQGAAEKAHEKSAVILLGGEEPKENRLLQYIKTAPYLAAADGGAAIALRLGRCPNLLIGDFDSLEEAKVNSCRQLGAELLELPVMKDMTDGEFLLDTLTERGFGRLLVLGAMGGRPDMELANIFYAESLAKRGAFCLLAHDNALLLPLYAEENPITLEINNFAGYTFSQVSLADRCEHITLDGFLYPLDGVLCRGQTLGLSNIIEKDRATVRLANGSLLIIINMPTEK